MVDRTSDPTGVIGCTEECKTTAMVCKLNHTIVEFRPNRAWRGEFGFDWLRVDDELDPGQVPGHVPGEPPYKDCILGSKKSGYTSAVPNAAAYNDLKTEYHKLSVNTHRASPKDEYFIPWLNLYAEDVSNKINDDYKTKNAGVNLPVPPPFEAELRLIVNVQGDTKPKELEIVFPSEFFTIEYPTGAAASGSPIKIPSSAVAFAPNSPGKNYDLADTITIKCIKEFSKDQYIDVWAHHYEHNQTKLDQLEQENKQLNDTDIPALEQEVETLKTQVTGLETKITAQEAKIATAKAPVDKLLGEIAALQAQRATKSGEQLAIETQLNTNTALPDAEKQNLQAQIERLKTEIAGIDAQIKAKTAELEAAQKQLEPLQAELDKLNTELGEKNTQIANKQTEIEEKKTQIETNKTEMDKVQGRTLAGKLCVCANDTKHRKTCKVLLVNVITNFDISSPPNPATEDKGALRPNEESMLYNTLYQALVYPEITKNITYDLSTDAKFKLPTAGSTGFIDAHSRVTRSTAGAFLDYLRTSFKNAHPTYSANDYWPIFTFGINGEGMGGVGWVGKNPCAVFTNGQGTMLNTPSHEILHNLGLEHTHVDYDSTYTTPSKVTPSAAGTWSINKDAMKYVYRFGGWDASHPDHQANAGTTSVISYTQNGYSTYRWHWQIMRNHL